MRSLSTEDQDRALRLLYWATKHRRAGKSEKWIATQLGCESPLHMYTEMKDQWGWPDWAVYPDPPKPRRKPRGTDKESKELPPSREAAPLLEEGKKRLERNLDALQYMHQRIKDGRFVTEGIYPKESGVHKMVFRKKELSQAQWRRDCEYWGQDPEVEEFEIPFDYTLAAGAQWYPHDLLVSVVATYALTGCPLEPLLEALCPTPPTEADSKELNEKREQLLLKARQLACMLRGEKVGPGPNALAVTPEDQVYAGYLQDPVSLGLSEEELEGEFGKQELTRLRGLRLPRNEADRE